MSENKGRGKKGKRNWEKSSGWILLVIGLIFVVLSIAYSSSPSAFVGLGLIFWGVLLTYIRNEEYEKQSVMHAIVISGLTTLNELMQQLNHNSRAIYLPPKHLDHSGDNKVYIPEQDGKLTIPENLTGNPHVITPIGSELTRLFEKIMGKSFLNLNIKEFERKIPTMLIEDLEIARDCVVEVKDNRVHVRIESPFYARLCKEIKALSNVHDVFDCPLNSAIACALAKTTGKPIMIDNQQISADDSIEIEYYIFDENDKPMPSSS